MFQIRRTNGVNSTSVATERLIDSRQSSDRYFAVTYVIAQSGNYLWLVSKDFQPMPDILECLIKISKQSVITVVRDGFSHKLELLTLDGLKFIRRQETMETGVASGVMDLLNVARRLIFRSTTKPDLVAIVKLKLTTNP